MLLVAIYLWRGERTRFPGAYEARAGTLRNSFSFATVRLWEHAAEIRSGALAELAPLLTMAEVHPDEETLRRERELILGLDVPEPVRADLLSIAITIGSRFFGREFLLRFFREELAMLKEASIVEEWIQEGEARGEARGEERGELRATRELTLNLLRARFGELAQSVVSRIEEADITFCRDLCVRLLTAQSLEELGL